jgi:catechol 2,3-dioxygenase-like lactoylglutathione lyase family enzyme
MRERQEMLSERTEPVSRVPPAPVDELSPFMRVGDVERSVRFYELLGFELRDTYRPGDRLEWAQVACERGSLMFVCSDEPVDARAQGILFYLYTDDLAALQRHLRAHGERAGQIHDGTPGPEQQTLVRDPDGYVLMIAQRDSAATGEARP